MEGKLEIFIKAFENTMAFDPVIPALRICLQEIMRLLWHL